MKWPPFHPEAGAEFDEAFDWYAEKSGKLARRFLDSTARTIEFLRTYPEAGTPISRHMRKFVIRPFSYSLIYLPGEDDIQIVAVAHHRRRPGYWTERLHRVEKVCRRAPVPGPELPLELCFQP